MMFAWLTPLLISLATAVTPEPGGGAPAVNADGPPDLAALKSCEDSLDIAIFNSPLRAWTKSELRVLVVSEKDIPDARIGALDPSGKLHDLKFEKLGGPPWGWVARVPKPKKGRWRVGIGHGSRVDACQKVYVRRWGRSKNEVEEGVVDPVWRSRIKWERDTENLYSLWVEYLFDAPLDAEVSWNPLHEVTRQQKRNLLYDHLGLSEDSETKRPEALKLKPDCADFPYVLRAYFAWKLGLPFGFRGCSRGNARRPPRCRSEISTNHMAVEEGTRVDAFEYFARRKVMGTVHSSSLRTLPTTEDSDFYPVKLTRKALRPGTIYADPYGHTLMVGKWYPQKGDQAGVLVAIDAQPDGTIGRRIFWKGSFLFPEDDAVKGAGFKRFRPIRVRRGVPYAFSNRRIAKSIDYGDWSTEQWDNGKEAFYERMDELISPEPVPPLVGLTATIDALEQQVLRRVESVENGEQWKRDHPGRTMPMPEGAAIFITSGPWEAYSTPSRDMRLLIAIDTVADFPERVARVPHRFRLPAGKTARQVADELKAQLPGLLAQRKFSYKRSDGSAWPMTLADVMARAEQWESSYNPNDCVEYRWGARKGQDEYATCKRRAPKGHRRAIERYRGWFQKRERPLH